MCKHKSRKLWRTAPQGSGSQGWMLHKLNELKFGLRSTTIALSRIAQQYFSLTSCYAKQSVFGKIITISGLPTVVIIAIQSVFWGVLTVYTVTQNVHCLKLSDDSPVESAVSLSTFVRISSHLGYKKYCFGVRVFLHRHIIQMPNLEPGENTRRYAQLLADLFKYNVYEADYQRKLLPSEAGIGNTNTQPRKQARLFALAQLQVQKLQSSCQSLMKKNPNKTYLYL